MTIFLTTLFVGLAVFAAGLLIYGLTRPIPDPEDFPSRQVSAWCLSGAQLDEFCVCKDCGARLNPDDGLCKDCAEPL